MAASGWPAASGKTILNLNPADHNDVVGEFPSSHAEDVERAVEAARKAFRAWRLTPAPRRAEVLRRAGGCAGQVDRTALTHRLARVACPTLLSRSLPWREDERGALVYTGFQGQTDR